MSDKPLLERVLRYPKLPSLPAVAVELLELTRDPNVKYKQIAKVVQNDVALAAKILKTVNSSYYGLSKPCATIERAMTYLGLNTVKSLVLGFSLVDSTRNVKGSAEFDLDLYWRQVIIAAVAARQACLAGRDVDPEEAFVGGLFQDVGVLALYVAAPEEYAEVLATQDLRSRQLASAEMETLGVSHAQVGAALARQWKLPPQLVACIEHHHAPGSAPDEFRHLASASWFASEVAGVLMSPTPGGAGRQLLRSVQPWMNLKREGDVEAFLTQVNAGVKEMARVFEKNVGQLPDVGLLMSEANEVLIEHQVAASREADKLREQNQSLETQATRDALTGAFNRLRFDAALPEYFARSGGPEGPLSMLFVDADKFKSINDTLGHPAGDAVLVELARRIIDVVGEAGLVCRYGGEEFAVLLPGADAPGAVSIAERVRAAVQDAPFDLSAVDCDEDERRVTVSLGVCTHSAATQCESGAQLVHFADQAVYQAKKAGRNRVCVHGHSRQATPPEPETLSAPDGDPGASAPHVRRVLLVDDDALVATLLSATFKRHKVDLVHRGDATAAIDLLGQDEDGFELILTDFMLPGIDGAEFIRLARALPRYSRLPVFVLSSTRRQDDRDACMAAGATGLLNKEKVATNLLEWTEWLIKACSVAQKAA